jgi:hypothetical protein
MYEADVFDAAVFGKLTAPRAATASLKPEGGQEIEPQGSDIDALIHQSMLSFNGLLASDKAARIHAFERGYRVELGSQRLAFDMGSFRKLLEDDNEGVDLAFSDELATYQPEEGLVRKSKVPLWVIRPVGTKVVTIQRIW